MTSVRAIVRWLIKPLPFDESNLPKWLRNLLHFDPED